jgi:hypothetical protein
MVRSFRRRRLEDEPTDDQSARVGAEAGAAFSFGFKEGEPAGRDDVGPTGQLGPSFKSVSSTGRQRAAESCQEGSRRSNGKSDVTLDAERQGDRHQGGSATRQLSSEMGRGGETRRVQTRHDSADQSCQPENGLKSMNEVSRGIHLKFSLAALSRDS